MARKRIGELLIEAGVISEQQLAAALAFQRQVGGRLGRILVEKKLVTEDRLVRMLSTQLGIPMGDLPSDAPPPALLGLIPRDAALSHAVFPVGIRRDPQGDVVFLAMADPTNIEAIEKLQLALGLRVMPFIAGELAIERAILQWLPAADAPKAAVAAARSDDSDEVPLVTGVLSTPAKGVPSLQVSEASFGKAGGMLGDANEEDGAMPPPIDLDNLTLAGPPLLQPPPAPQAPAAPPALLQPEPEELELVDLDEPAEPAPKPAQEPAALSATRCPECGAERLATARFCPHCGCSFTGAARATSVVEPAAPAALVLQLFRPGAAAPIPAGASDASRSDDVDVLLGNDDRPLARVIPLPLAIDPTPSDASQVDEPAVLAAAAPKRRSLAADWADVAERPIARKEHGSAELAAQRGRELMLAAPPAAEEPAAPMPEPQVTYEPAAAPEPANPAPWAAFASVRAATASRDAGTTPAAPPRDRTEKK